MTPLVAVLYAAVACAVAAPAAASRQLMVLEATDPAYSGITQTLETRAFGLQTIAEQSADAAAQRAGSESAALRVGPAPGAVPEQNVSATAANQRVAAAATLCGNGVCDAGESCVNCPMDCRAVPGPNGKPCQRVGVMYSGW